jgi:hypothetical protein
LASASFSTNLLSICDARLLFFFLPHHLMQGMLWCSIT